MFAEESCIFVGRKEQKNATIGALLKPNWYNSFWVGALGKPGATWGDLAGRSTKVKCTQLFAWVGVILISIGFLIQICIG